MQLTKQQATIFALLDALGEAIRSHDWPTALPLWQELLKLYAPLGEWQPDLGTVLRNNSALVEIAAQQTNKIH